MTDFWAARPPEVNDFILRAGAGVGTTAAAAVGYAMELAGCETAAGVSMGNAAALAPEFVGVAGIGSQLTQTMLNTTLHLLSAWLMEKPPVFATAINAYLTATSTMIPAALCEGNRVQWEALCAANIPALGMLTPQIIEKDVEYFGGMWPNNAGVGTGYSATLMALIPALAVPPPITAMGASPAAPAEAGAAVAEATAAGAAGTAMQASKAAAGLAGEAAGGPAQGMDSVIGQVSGVTQQVGQVGSQLMQTVTGIPMQLGQTAFGAFQALPGMFGSFGRGETALAPELADEAVPRTAEPVRATGGVPVSAGLGPTAGSGPARGAAVGLTSYTRPSSNFAPESGGRPTGWRTAGTLNAAEARVATGGAAMPMAPGMLGRAGTGSGRAEDISRVKVVAGSPATRD